MSRRSESSHAPSSDASFRSLFVTLFGWLCIAGGAATLPVAVLSLLMLLAGGDGSESATLLGGLGVIGGPPAMLATGIGLWRRWRWAYPAGVALLVAVVVWNVVPVLRGPTPERVVTSPAGVPTTVSASEVDHPFHGLAIAIALGLLAKLLTPSVRAEFSVVTRRGPGADRRDVREAAAVHPDASPGAALQGGGARRQSAGRTAAADRERGWRVGHQGRDEMFYEERVDGAWQRLRISGELLTGRAHHVIYFASPQAWREYPEWAQARRDEIIARIQSEFRAPDYEYQGVGGDGAEPAVGVGTSGTQGLSRAVADRAAGSPTSASAASLAAAPAVGAATPAPALAPTPHATGRAPAGTTPRSAWRALLIAIALLLGIAAGAGWLVQRGLARGETWLPSPRASQSRTVLRADEPATFWASLGVYAALGLASLGGAVWLMRAGRQLRSRERGGR